HEMGEYERPDTISSRGLCGVWYRRVVVEHIGESGQPNLLDEIPPDNGVHKHIGVGTQFVKTSTRHRVAGDDHRSPSFVDSESDGRADGRVISGRGGDLDRAIFEDDTLTTLGPDRVRAPRQVPRGGEPVADFGFKDLLGVSEECGRAV